MDLYNFEEYTYITVRGIIFQILSIVMMFAFVKTQDDYCIYAGITVFAAVGANVLNFFGQKILYDSADDEN